MTKNLNKFINNLLDKIHFKRKYPHVSLFMIFRIYTAVMMKSYDVKIDRIIKKIIDNFDHIEKIESSSSHCTITIFFGNGNSVNLWTTNLWYSFLSRTTLQWRNKNNIEEYNECRPSRKMMIEFLEKFHNYIVKMGDSLVVVNSQNDNLEDFFSFKNKEEKEDGQNNG